MTTSVFDAPPPQFAVDHVATLARTLFGIDGVAAPLASERDQNVRVGAHVVKVANAAEAPAALDLQSAALRHLAAVAPGLALPRLVEPGVLCHEGHLVRAVTWLPGTPYAEAAHTSTLRASLGAFMGRMSAALQGFGHPAAHQPEFLWNLDRAQAVRPWVADITDTDGSHDAALAEAVFARHEREIVPRLPLLRGAVIHADANDWNVLTDGHRVAGLIDFGDMVWARQVNELAITLAYALLDVNDVVAAATDVISAYHTEFPLLADEMDVLWDLVATRLAMSLAISSHRSREHPDNAYLLVSQLPVRRLLRRIVASKPGFLRAAARAAVGWAPVSAEPEITFWLASADCHPRSPLPFDVRRAPRVVVSLAGDAPLTAIRNPVDSWDWIQREMAVAGAVMALGRYDEDRSCYAGDQFTTDAPEPRSVHTGIDLFVEVDTPVRAMLPGTVETVVDNASPYDYGPTVILRHHTGAGTPFWVLYGHLSRATLSTVQPGQAVAAAEVIGFVGDHTVNGGWAPHVHLQVMTDLLLERWGEHDAVPDGNFEGAGEPSRMTVWRSLVPNADLLLRFTPETWADTTADDPAVLAERRHADLGPSLSVSYRRPLTIVRGEGAWLFDHTGRGLLDCVNNVAHVGHAHPHVVESIARQAAVLNTNTRYLHRTILDYSERLAALFPAPLRVVYLTNSGSEANELALRIARTATGRRDVVAVDWGYHGNTTGLVEISAYKFNRRGGGGRPAHTHLADLPDPYRGAHGADGPAYAASVAEACARAAAEHGGAAAFIAESISGCGGQVVFPDGYLAAAFRAANAAGAVTIADEVQVGFGRAGSHLWAFGPQLEGTGVVPDIVTLGKPIGNGHPLGAVVTTPELAAAFANGMEWFNTFGGNPVSCAAGMAVLDVIETEGLQDRARQTGRYLLDGFSALAARHPSIGDVRGMGMYLGIDLVTDRATKAHATSLAGDVANALRDRGVLISTDGPHDNVLKIKPPLVVGRAEADILLTELDATLTALGA